MSALAEPRAGGAPPRPRRFGRVNWIGLWTLYRRDVWRVLKDYRESMLGVGVTALLYLVAFRIAGGEVPVPGGVGFAVFLAPGLAMTAMCQQAFSTSAASLIFDKMEGMIADPLMAPLSPAERSLAYAASSTTGGLVAGAAALAVLATFVPLPLARPEAALFFAVAGCLLHGLLGLLAGIVSVRWDHFAAWLGFVVIPVSFLSGAFYPLANLPPAGRLVVAWNPVFHAIDGFRFGFTGVSEGRPWLGALVLLALDAALFLAVLRLFARGTRLKP